MDITFVNIFVPTKLLRYKCGVILGYYSRDVNKLNVNITAMCSINTLSRINYYDLADISVLGIINSNDNHVTNNASNSGDECQQFWCELSLINQDLELVSCVIDGVDIDDGIVTIIYYDTRDFMSSQLFGKQDNCDNRMKFVEFIIESLRKTSNLFKSHFCQTSDQNITFPIKLDDHVIESTDIALDDDLRLMLPRRLTASFIEFHYYEQRPKFVKTHVRNKSWFPNQRQITNFLMDFIMMTTTGNQLRFRLRQFHQCWEAIKALRHKRISVDVGNVLSSVAIDIILGVITTLFLVFYSSPSHWLDVALKHTDNLVNEVQSLLNLLMGMPAGLKLNRPLNTALGQFFLYHIYLWKTYMIIIKPLFAITVETLVYCGVFGFTCILSVLSDLVSLATIHIYCFYGYAARLYGLQVIGLSALWRLFRGKKWNQLRSRVDSYSYGNDQLFIGTLSFTILLFLLPTVLMYYLVFLVLRVVTLSVQGALRFLIEFMSSMPLYMICLWIVSSKKVAAEVSFELIPHSGNGAVKLLLKTKKVSFSKVLSTKNDELKSLLSGTRVSWSDFIQSVIWGRIIYPM